MSLRLLVVCKGNKMSWFDILLYIVACIFGIPLYIYHSVIQFKKQRYYLFGLNLSIMFSLLVFVACFIVKDFFNII